jgi:regulator of protease activity HflC (stomatin/prohibitin superfamily)
MATQNSASQLGIGRPLRALAIAWGGGLFLSLILAFAVAFALGVVLAALTTVGVSIGAIQLLQARSRAIREREAVLWGGLARIVSWNPTEGVVFLKNKQIDFVDDNPHDGGGIRVIYPILGHELVLRVPLEIQTLTFRDTEVLTREYMPLTIQGTIYWKVFDLARFYLYISKEIHTVNDSGGHAVATFVARPKFEVAEQWLRAMAEEKTRKIVSQIGTGLLIADQLASDLSHVLPESSAFLRPLPESSPRYRSATDGLAEVIKNEFASVVSEYGLEIHRVAIQEVKLPPEIYAAAVDACKSAYLPLKAQAEAAERRLKLQAEADVIGKDATGLKEIAGNIPALAFQEFLAPLFLDFNRRRALGGAAPESAARLPARESN